MFDQEVKKFLQKTLSEKIDLPDEIISKEEDQIDYKAYRSESKFIDCDSSNSVEEDEKETDKKQNRFEFSEIMCIVCGVLLSIVIILLIVLLYLHKRTRIVKT